MANVNLPRRLNYCQSILVFSLALCTLFGCTPKQDAAELWQNYAKRLNYVLADDSKATELVLTAPQLSMAPFTAKLDAGHRQSSTLLKQETSATISLLDLASLDSCALGQLIASHNNSLGKVATASQQLVYLIRFIQVAPICISQLEDTELKVILEQALAEKKLIAVSEFNHFLQRDQTIAKRLFIGSTSLEKSTALYGLSETELALNQLLNIKTAMTQQRFDTINANAIEASLDTLNRSNILNGYFTSLTLNQSYLAQISTFLELHTKDALCEPGHRNNKTEILINVFNKYFLSDIQGYGSDLATIEYRLAPVMSALFRQTKYQYFIDAYFGDANNSSDTLAINTQNRTEFKRHVAWWKQILESCGETRTKAP